MVSRSALMGGLPPPRTNRAIAPLATDLFTLDAMTEILATPLRVLSYAVDKECAAAIRDAEDCLSSGEAISAVLRDRGGLSVWSGTKALA
jgi:hypothetical protein